jgi:hypothetical protein
MYVMIEFRSSLKGKAEFYDPQLRIAEYHVRYEEVRAESSSSRRWTS